MTRPSLRNPHISLEDTIAAKLGVLIEGMVLHRMTQGNIEDLSKEIVGDIRDLIRQEIMRARTDE